MVKNTKMLENYLVSDPKNRIGRKLVWYQNTPKWWNICVTSENGFFGLLNFDLEPKKGVKCENWRLLRNYGIKSLTMAKYLQN